MFKFFLIIIAFCASLLSQSFAFTSPPPQETVPVHIALYINDITTVNQKIEVIEIEATLFVSWVDPRLAFDPDLANTNQKDYENMRALNKLTEIWHPNIVITKTRGARNIINSFLSISSEGKVTFIDRFNVDVETALNLRKFPFDRQALMIALAPFSKNYNKIQLIIDPSKQGISPDAHLAEWSIKGISSKISTYNSVISGENTPVYILSLDYQRQWPFYVFRLLVPLLVIIMLSWSVFWLRGQPVINSIAVAFTALLTIVAFQWVIAENLPKVSYQTFFQNLLLLSYISIGLTIFGLVMLENISEKSVARYKYWFRLFIPLFYIISALILYAYFFL